MTIFFANKFQMTDRLKCCLHQVITHQSSLLENYFKSLLHSKFVSECYAKGVLHNLAKPFFTFVLF